MNIIVSYSPSVERCKMLSAYEAREAVDANGERKYDSVRITDDEQSVILTYIKQSAELLESMLTSALLSEGDYTSDEQVTWEMSEDVARRKGGNNESLIKSCQDAFAVFAMSKWLENKLPEQSQAYLRMWGDLSTAAVRIARQKRKPSRPN